MRSKLYLIVLVLFGAIQATGQPPAAAKPEGKPLWQPYYLMPRSGSQHLALSADWQLTYLDQPVADGAKLPPNLDWIPVAQPTSVHMALFKAGKLPNPYVDLNTKQYDWIPRKAWYYRKSFTLVQPAGKTLAFLSFDGLDYFARVWLNGQLLGRHEGMFGGPEVEVSELLRYGATNELVVELLAGNYYNEKGQGNGIITNSFADNAPGVIRPWALAGGFAHEMFYVMGMWQGARLDLVPAVHLERPFLTTTALSEREAVIRLKTELFTEKHSLLFKPHPWEHEMLNTYPPVAYAPDTKLALEVRLSTGKDVFTQRFPLQVFPGRNFIEKEFRVPNPKVWHPNGTGEPALYKAEVILLQDGQERDRIAFDYGIRTIEWVPSAGPAISERWTNWQCVVNGRKLFLKGTNWMPAEMLLDLPPEKYRWALQMARDAGIQLVRIWGAGLQEPDAFYQLCNQMGLMVWQDFTMNSAASNRWPQDVWEAQVLHTIFRIRNNPSLAVYGGGNETNPYSLANAQAIGILERNLKLFDDTRFFTRTTPDLGSIHPYPTYDAAWYRRNFKFMPFFGETGFFGMATAQTIRETIPAAQLNDFTRMADSSYRQKHPAVIHQFNSYAPLNVGKILNRSSHYTDVNRAGVDELAEASQAGAAEYFQLLIEAARDNYPVTTGLMTWVFKRPYPVFAGHQIIDGMDRPLMAYYAVKKAYEPVHTSLGIERTLWRAGETIPLRVSVQSALPGELTNCQLSVRVLDDRFRPRYTLTKPVTVPGGEGNTTLEMGTFTLPADYRERFFFVLTELKDPSGRLLTRSVYWPRTLARMEDETFYKAYTGYTTQEWPLLSNGPWLKQTLQTTSPQTTLKLELAGRESVSDQEQLVRLKVSNTGKAPSCLTEVSLESGEYIFYNSDNFFWLEPGESRELQMRLRRRTATYPAGKERSVPTLILRSWNARPQQLRLPL